MNLETLSIKSLQKQVPRGIVIAFLVLSFIGFVDSIYLTGEYFSGGVPNCSIIKGCEEVTTSPYATIGFIPIALLGALYYITVFLLALLYRETKEFHFIKKAFYVVSIGFVFTLWLLYLQAFTIGAFCQYCLISAVVTTSLFVLGIIAVRKARIRQ